MNQNQIYTMTHAIRNSNRFYASKNNKDWNDLVEKGYATKHDGWEEDMAYYRVTPEGQLALSQITE